jgi:catechol 2,3-dioxygenase-like lactoylglutathione lyase family enzyme
MFDHIGLKVRNLEASIRFYRSALASLGCQLDSSGDGYAGFGPPGQPALWLYADPNGATGTTHMALRAPNRAAVERFHAQGLASGGRDNGAPGVRTDYAPNYYAAFLLDPDGHNVEAVCLT